MTGPEIITGFKDIVLAIAAASTAIVAAAGLKTWNRELKGKAEFEAARNLARATYKLRDALKVFRAPFYSAGEFPEGYKGALNHHAAARRIKPYSLYLLKMKPKSEWVLADFNGILEPGLLCLSHTDDAKTAQGQTISLREGIVLTAFDLDADEKGNSDDIFATGVVERSPSYAQCKGSLWSLRIDSDGIRHESDIKQV